MNTNILNSSTTWQLRSDIRDKWQNIKYSHIWIIINTSIFIPYDPMADNLNFCKKKNSFPLPMTDRRSQRKKFESRKLTKLYIFLIINKYILNYDTSRGISWKNTVIPSIRMEKVIKSVHHRCKKSIRRWPAHCDHVFLIIRDTSIKPYVNHSKRLYFRMCYNIRGVSFEITVKKKE